MLQQKYKIPSQKLNNNKKAHVGTDRGKAMEKFHQAKSVKIKKIEQEQIGIGQDSVTKIFLPGLCDIAAVRAHHFSPNGLKYKDYLSDPRYLYTGWRIRKLINRWGYIPPQIIDVWKTSTKPGFVVYKKTLLRLPNRKVSKWTEATSEETMLAELRSGTVYRVESGAKITSFESYVYDPNEWTDPVIKALPVFDPMMVMKQELLPIWTAGVQVFKIGQWVAKLGLPTFYKKLEASVSGVPMLDDRGKYIASDLLNYFSCLSISNNKFSTEYRKWNPSFLQDKDRLCLRIDGVGKGFDETIVQKFRTNGMYILSRKANVWVRFKLGDDMINGRIVISTSRSYKLSSVMFDGYGKHDEDALFDFIFKFSSDRLGDVLSTVGLERKHWSVLYAYPSAPFQSADFELVLSKLRADVTYDINLLYMIAPKGMLKSSFIRYIRKYMDNDKFVFIDSDDYGAWVTNVQNGRNHVFGSDYSSMDSKITQLASDFLQDIGIPAIDMNPRVKENAIRLFGDHVQRLYEDSDLGLLVWLTKLTDALKQKNIFIMLHSNLELRTLYQGSVAYNVFSPFNGRFTCFARDRINKDKFFTQVFLYDFWAAHIDNTSKFIEYRDIMTMVDVDNTVQIDSMEGVPLDLTTT